ncbi:MAG: hypothetical protein ABI615_08670 [Chthoniobacterales bacterium]
MRKDLEACLRFQAALPVTSVIAPGIVIRQRFNSVEAVIAKNYLRNARDVWDSVGDNRPLLGTLAIDAEALQDRHALEEFLAEITVMDSPPNGFYLLVHQPTSEIPSELIDSRTLAGWMLVNHSLSLNGFDVVNGYSDLVTPFLGAAGGAAGATGWFNTQKVFSLDRFAPPLSGGRRPVLFRVPPVVQPDAKNLRRLDWCEQLRHVGSLAGDAIFAKQIALDPPRAIVGFGTVMCVIFRVEVADDFHGNKLKRGIVFSDKFMSRVGCPLTRGGTTNFIRAHCASSGWRVLPGKPNHSRRIAKATPVRGW